MNERNRQSQSNTSPKRKRVHQFQSLLSVEHRTRSRFQQLVRLQNLRFGLILLCAAIPGSLPKFAEAAEGKQGMVATVHPRATQAGLDVLESGGNAIDAAIASAMMLGVVDGYNSGIGGGCFILIRTADGKLVAIDGRETAPAKASRDMYLKNGKPQTAWSQTGPLAVATPGALFAYDYAHGLFGKAKWKDLVKPATEVAYKGFELDEHYAARLATEAPQLAQFEGSRAVFFKPNGKVYEAGDTLRQKDLAITYREIENRGASWFYEKRVAQKVSAWMADNGGVLSFRDFAAYKPIVREPLKTTYRGYTIVGFPPPSSGGVHVAQILNTLEPFNMAKLHAENPATFTHVLAEAMKLAFADRAFWLGDPAFAQVPRGLTSAEYGRSLALKIKLDAVTPVEKQGQPPRANSDFFPRHTTHIATADAAGNWVAITTTINTSFGSKIIVPGTGVLLNNQMDDFSIQPGVPNAFGLVGAEANAIAPGKRPLSSMSPTIVMKGDEPVLTVGAAGGPKIITQVVQTIVRSIDLKQPLSEAVDSPRVHHQWRPDVLLAEETVPRAVIQRLKSLGHDVRPNDYSGVTQAISRDGTGTFHGVSDPRVKGSAAGY
jgi:gamma-glutamyltranspeptidase/glutathione hydrolase